MTQNRSSAVMQRRTEPHDSLDDFPTPPWATRALCEWLQLEEDLDCYDCREPTANRGHMVKPLEEYFSSVIASDVFDYGCGYRVDDYLFGQVSEFERTEWSIFNPPFKVAEQFIERALELSNQGVAAFVRSAFLESVGRYERLFKLRPPTDVLQFTERVVLHKGKLAPKGSTATAYAWSVWKLPLPLNRETRFHWIPPCRKRLEKASDYA